jgi:hypothetical protein
MDLHRGLVCDFMSQVHTLYRNNLGPSLQKETDQKHVIHQTISMYVLTSKLLNGSP